MIESRLVQRAKGLLKVFNEAGVLEPADIHVALRLQQLGGESAEQALLAIALAVRAVRLGSVCVDLTRLSEVTVDENVDIDVSELPWPTREQVVAALRRSPLVVGSDAGPLRPVRLVDTDEGELLYLDRYFSQEQTIRTILDERASRVPPVDLTRLADGLDQWFGPPGRGGGPDRQRIAAALAVTQWTTVIGGGPGTGKTHTVARILSLLFSQSGPTLRVGLCAPTGRAAAQLQQSVTAQTQELALPVPLVAMTVHRLLGWQSGSSSRFRHHASNHLPYDVVVVDETSMVSLTLMCRLLEAVRPDARLILVGDPDQLTSVDAGAVLADLVARPIGPRDGAAIDAFVGAVAGEQQSSDHPGPSTPVREQRHTDPPVPAEPPLTPMEREQLVGGVVRLSRGRRFGRAIDALAGAVREGRADDVLDLLDGGSPELSFHDIDDLDPLRDDVVGSAEVITAAARAGDAEAALAGLGLHRLLCAHREGPYGVTTWARQGAEWIAASPAARPDGPAQQTLTPSRRRTPTGAWFPGQPLLVTANDYETKIYNGDTGVVIAVGDEGGVTAAFRRADGAILIHPSRLADVQTVYAMTIHRSQGSQYDTVSVVLPGAESALLTRELLYTAITRATHRVRVIGTRDSVRAGVDRQVSRASGLRRTFREPGPGGLQPGL